MKPGAKRLYITGDAPTRFSARIKAVQRCSDMTACQEWQGSRDHKGYGRFNAGTGLEPRYVLAHRFAMEIEGLLDDRPLLHKCDNPPCCNTEHLRSGSVSENNADMRSKGRHAFGGRIGGSRLTEAQVTEIVDRFRSGEPMTDIAGDFPAAYRTVVDAAQGVTWKHVTARRGDEVTA